MLQSLALIFHVVLAVTVICLVLIQHGKGADAGAAFGSGASATVFGARGATSFLTRATTIGAAAFFATSLFLFYLAAHREGSVRSVTDVPGLVDEAPLAPAVSDGDLPGVIVPAAPDADVIEIDVPAVPEAGEALPEPVVSETVPAEAVEQTPAQ